MALVTAVAAVLAAHNRCQTTLRCLEALHSQDAVGLELAVYLLDDASSDGTAAAVAERFPGVRILFGDGSLFWNGGMRQALTAALADGYDGYLLLNDDTVLERSALRTLLEAAKAVHRTGLPRPIVVGSTHDPATGALTYGGLRRASRRRPLRFMRVTPGATPLRVDTFEANCVLIPAEVAQRLGNLDPAFVHAMGDNDYGLRATAEGFEVWLAPGTVGACQANPLPEPGQGRLRAELRALTSRKQLPPRDWAVFARRWAGPLWPLYWASPYVRRAASSIRTRVRARFAP